MKTKRAWRDKNNQPMSELTARISNEGLRLVELEIGMEDAYRDMESEHKFRPDKTYRAANETWTGYIRRLQRKGLRNRLSHTIRTIGALLIEWWEWRNLKELISYGVDLPSHLKPPRQTYVHGKVLWLVDKDCRILGRSEIRTRATPFLVYEGGQLAFEVRPSERGKGYASLIARLTYPIAKEMGFKRIMLSCEPNSFSEKVIIRSGGKFENIIMSSNQKPKARYWLDLDPF